MSTPGTPQPQGVVVIGPDQKKYQFPAGTTKDKAVAYFKTKGIGAAPKATSTPASGEVQLKPFAAPSAENLTAKHAGQQAVQGLKELGGSIVDVGKDFMHNPNWVFGHESVFQHVITDPAGRQAMEANAAWKLHQYDRAGIHEIAGALPLVGPWVGELYEQSVTGDPLGAVAKGGAQALAAEATGKVVKGVKEAVKDPKLMARQLEMKASHPEIPEKALDAKEMAEAGRAMAESKVIASKLTLPRKLNQIIKAKGSQVDQIVKQADESGVTADVSKTLDKVVQAGRDRAVALNDKEALDALDRPLSLDPKTGNFTGKPGWKQFQMYQLDPTTKQWTPRKIASLKPSELLKDTKRLGGEVKWEGKPAPDAIDVATKTYRKALNDHLNDVAPGTAKLRADESALIKNREGALEMAKKSFMGSSPTFVSYFRSPGTLGAYALLKGLGFSWIGAIAPVVGLKTLWDSTLSRTARAAILQRAGEIIDGTKPSSAAQGGQPATPTAPPVAPQTPPTPPSPTPAPAGAPPTQAGRMQLPPGAQQAMQTFQQAKQLAGPTAPIEQVVITAQKIKAVKALQAAVGPQVAQTTPQANVAPSGPPNAANPLQGNNLGAAAPAVAKIAEGVSGVGPKAKALLDRLDELTQRVPKSGKDRQDIAREIDDIKKAAATETTDADRKAITERVQARERQQKHRAKAQAETPGASSTAAKEPIAAGGNPETQTMLIDAGLNKLSKLGEIGRNAAKASKREAIMHKWSFAEHAAQITEQIEFLSSHPELTTEDVK